MSQTKVQKGLFIVLEGIDGAGTTTQLNFIKSALEARGREVHLTREPSDNPVGLMLRQVLKGTLAQNGRAVSMNDDTVALLFAADRLHHLSAEILPAMAAGKVVISDRYYGSSAVYQGPLCGGEWVKAINSRAVEPDLTLYFHLPVAEASRRRAGRGGPVERFEEDSFLTRVQERYDALYQAGRKVALIDASQSIEGVTAACLAAIYPLLSE